MNKATGNTLGDRWQGRLPFEQVVSLCATFTQEWESERRPDIPSYLDRVAAGSRATLLRNLLARTSHAGWGHPDAGQDRRLLAIEPGPFPQGLLPLRPGGSARGALRGAHGVNSLFGDGSVHFMKNSISAMTWVQLGSIKGGEVISADQY
jgi:hypothetical protein